MGEVPYSILKGIVSGVLSREFAGTFEKEVPSNAPSLGRSQAVLAPKIAMQNLRNGGYTTPNKHAEPEFIRQPDECKKILHLSTSLSRLRGDVEFAPPRVVTPFQVRTWRGGLLRQLQELTFRKYFFPMMAPVKNKLHGFDASVNPGKFIAHRCASNLLL